MKFITYKINDIEQIGLLSNDEQNVYPLKKLGLSFNSMNDLIVNITENQLAELKNREYNNISSDDIIPYSKVQKCAPIPKPNQDIICLGINYMAHAEESARYKKRSF